MTEQDYRADDVTDQGYCPKCGEPLTGLTVAARGYCDIHGWVFADWMSTDSGIERCAYCVVIIRPGEARHLVNGDTYCDTCAKQLNIDKGDDSA